MSIEIIPPKTIKVDESGIFKGNVNELDFVGATVTVVNKKATITVAAGVSYLVSRTVFVDEVFGNDATGTPTDPTKPFLTKQAAIVAALAILTPTATNRVLISDAMALSIEPIYFPIACSGIDFDLNGGSIVSTNATYAGFDDNDGIGGSFAIDSIVYNAKEIKSTIAGRSGLKTANAASNVTIHGNVASTLFIGALCSAGTQKIFGNSSGVLSSQLLTGNQTITGNLTGGVECYAGTQTITGNINSSANIGANCFGGTQKITGNVSSVAGFIAVNRSAGTQIIIGNISALLATAVYSSGAGIQKIIGDISATSTGAYCDNSTQTIYGNISSDGPGVLCSTSGIQTIYGDISSISDVGANCIGGVQTITGNITAALSGAQCSNGTQTITGNISSTGFYGAYCNTTGEQTINGNISALIDIAAYCDTSESQTINGNISSPASFGAISTTGTQTINGNITSEGIGAYCDGAIQHITGNITCGVTATAAVFGINSANQKITGNVSASGAMAASCYSSSTQIIEGNITAADAGIDTQTSGIQTVYGDINSVGQAVYCNVGIQRVYGNVSSTSSTGVYILAGTQSIYGNISAPNSNGARCFVGTQTIIGNVSGLSIAATCSTGVQTITGNCSSTNSTGVECDGGVQTINGNITSNSTYATHCSLGTQTINNSRIVTTGANKSAVRKTGGTVILGNCVLIGTGTGFAIESAAAESVKIYPGRSVSNKLLQVVPLITLQVGTVANGGFIEGDANVI